MSKKIESKTAGPKYDPNKFFKIKKRSMASKKIFSYSEDET